jgi:hypothetical protein
VPGATADVGDDVMTAEVVRRNLPRRARPGDGAHRRVEDLTGDGVETSMLPHVHPKGAECGVLAGADAVQLPPRLPLVVAAQHAHDRTSAQRMVAAQIVAHRRDREATATLLREDTDRRERP